MKRTVTMLFCVALLLLLFTYRGKSIRVTICDLNEAGDMVVMSEDRQNTYVVNDCARYIPTGEELHIGDIVKFFIGETFRKPLLQPLKEYVKFL